MSESKIILEMIRKYFISLGYDEQAVLEFLDLNKIKEMIVMRLADSNIVTRNKENNGHQTHIAITGESVQFFYSKDQMKEMSNEKVDKRYFCISNQNIQELKGEVVSINQTDKIEFIEGNVSVGKRTQNQVQLSKNINENCSEFNNLRDQLHTNDLLVLIKLVELEKIYALGIKEVFYLEEINDYVLKYNSNYYYVNVSKEDNSNQEKRIDEHNKITFDVFAEKNTDQGVNCYLCGCSLKEFIINISENYKDNIIQRGIVKNVYLDRLVQTVLDQDNIPTIILVGEGVNICDEGKKIEVNQYRILDGLQRTYRIQEIWKCMDYFEKLSDKNTLLEMNKLKIARTLSKELSQVNCDINIFLEILNEYRRNGNIDRYWRYFNENIQWFEVWENLSPDQETKKMLILNAGHKQMDIRHQLELLFLNLLPKLNEQCIRYGGIGIIRNRDKSDMQYSKERKQGEFYFSHIISAVISYVWKCPVATNTDLVNELQQNTKDMMEYFNYDHLKNVMKFLISLDNKLQQEYE